MAAAVKISVFMGGDRSYPESVEEYLEDVEAAALSWDSYCSPHMVIDAEATDKSTIRFFRQNLGRQGDAWHWWHYVLEDSKKTNWAAIKSEFVERYGSKVTQAASLFEVQNEIISVAQGEHQHITDYVREVEKLSRRVPKEMDSLLGISFIKGMKDDSRRERVSFDLKDSPNFTFARALSVVKAAYRMIGEADPFNPKNQSANGNTGHNGQGYEDDRMPMYALPEDRPAAAQASAVKAMRVHDGTTGPARDTQPPVLPTEQKLSTTQEEFNAMMRSFMSSMGFSVANSQSPVSPHNLPSWLRQPGGYRNQNRATTICYNCGIRGHYSDSCPNPPLSIYERQLIRENDRREKEERGVYDYGRRQATGSNLIEVPPQSRRMILAREKSTEESPQEQQYEEQMPASRRTNQVQAQHFAPDTSRMSPQQPSTSACVKAYSTGRRDLGEACAVLARIPAVATIFEKTLVEKRARVEELDETEEEQRAGRQVRQRVADRETASPQPSHSQIVYDTATDLMEDVEIGFLDSGTQTTRVIRKAPGQKVPAPPIKWMKGERQYTIEDALTGSGLNPVITLPQLLDCSPRLRRDLAELLRSSLPRVRKRREAEVEPAPVTQVGVAVESTGTAKVLSEAPPNTGQEMDCLYIEAWVGAEKIPDVLVDGGAMLELISKELVQRLNLVRYPVEGLAIRLADDRLIPLQFYVWLDVVVAGVLARIKAFEVEVTHTYQLLLSRRWLRRVKAIEYHAAQTLFLEGSDFVRRKTTAIPMAKRGLKQPPRLQGIEVSCLSPLEVNDEEAEEAVETLLSELDHWNTIGERGPGRCTYDPGGQETVVEKREYSELEELGQSFGREKMRGFEWKKSERIERYEEAIDEVRDELPRAVLTTTALTRNKAQLFPTTRRPERRALVGTKVTKEEIEKWFSTSGIKIGTQLSAVESMRVKRLLFTWRDIFETDLLRIRQTDLIEHAIVLLPGAKPTRARIPLYTEEEIAFCQKLLPKMEEAGLIFRCDSAWGARTKIVLKPNAEEKPPGDRLRMVQNFIPLNRVTEKSRYPCPRIEQIVHTVLKKGKKYFFTSDAANSYWAIPVRKGDEHKLGFVTPYGMYCYTVMGQGLTGGTHTYSRFRDLVFGAIPEGLKSDVSGEENCDMSAILPGAPSLIGDHGKVAFDGMIDDSYGSAETFEDMFTFLHEQFFPRCAWGPMYLKGEKCHFFRSSLGFVGLEASDNGLRPSLKKRDTILRWPTPTTFEEVEAFCYLTPFLRRFIPGKAELVRVLKYGLEYSGSTTRKKAAEEEFVWTADKQVAFQAIKQAIANNAMAAPDPNSQYHLAVDASKRGIGGVLFQLTGVESGVEATNSAAHREAERIIMFMSFRLADTETRYSNSEREALAVVRCLAEVKWMVTASEFPILVYTDHQALRVLLTGLDNDAHGRIARWQERLGEYNINLLHRSATTHFMGIADGLSRLPTRWLQPHIAEDSEGPKASCIVQVQKPGYITPAGTFTNSVPMNSTLSLLLRGDYFFWQPDGVQLSSELGNKSREGVGAAGRRGERDGGSGVKLGDLRANGFTIGVVGASGQEGILALGESGEVREVAWEGDRNQTLKAMASNLPWRDWERWLRSGFYGRIVQLRLMELDRSLLKSEEGLVLGRNEEKVLRRQMRNYVMVEGKEMGLFYREKDGQLARCLLENEVDKALWEIHELHGHFAAGVTKGRAHGRVYWPTRSRDIDRWVASCDSCQRVTRRQRIGDIKPIIQFKPMDMIGMDFVGPINPPYQATGSVYILLVIDYFSRFLFAFGLPKADQRSTMSILLERVIPVVGWPLTVYTDNGTHFTGQVIRKMRQDHGVLHFTSAISHPQSVGLSERYVQMLMGRIRLKCLSIGTATQWGLHIRDAVLDINTRCIRVHGYTPAEILLGFNPATTRQETTGFDDWIKKSVDLQSPETQKELQDNYDTCIRAFLDAREESGAIALEKLARAQDQTLRKQTPGYRKPQVGDLVLVRDMQLAKDHGRKLEPRWSTPRLLERISASGVSAHIRQLHDPPGITKRFHLDDLRLYISRESRTPTIKPIALPVVTCIRDAWGNQPGSFVDHQRAFDLPDIGLGGNGNIRTEVG